MAIKKTIFLILLFALLLPTFNSITNLIKCKSLQGGLQNAANVNWDLQSWINGTYQTKKDSFWKDNFGFREDMIRLNNQLDYSIVHKYHTNGVILGKNNNYFEENYIKSRLAIDTLNEEKVEENVLKIKNIQYKIEKLGKKFVFIIACGKGWYYPEDIPDSYDKSNKISSTNYMKFKKYFNKYQIHYIDFNEYFIAKKQTTPSPLITKQGVHWSSYGASIVMDSIIKYLSIQLNINMVSKNSTYYTFNKYNAHDKEITEAFNLIWGIPCSENTLVPYQNYNTINKIKPSAIFSADSYFWEIYSQQIPNNIFRNSEFWYYNNERWTNNGKVDGNPMDDDTNEIIKKSDVFVMMASEFHLDCLTDAIYDKFNKSNFN